MELTSVVIRAVLGTVFLVAGVAKLIDLKDTARSIEAMGIPPRLSPSLAVVVPTAEMITALALLPERTAAFAAAASLSILTVFSALILWNLLRGRNPECHCFGPMPSRPINGRYLLRNGVLAVGSVVVMWQTWPGPGTQTQQPSWSFQVSAELATTIIMGVAVVLAAQFVFIILLARAHRAEGASPIQDVSVKVRGGDGFSYESVVNGLPVGDPAPHFELPDIHGVTHTLTELMSNGKPIALVFTESKCAACRALIPEIQRWQELHSEKMNFAAVNSGSRRLGSAARDQVLTLFDENNDVHAAYGVQFTPSFVLVSSDGTLASGLAIGSAAIRAEVAAAAGSSFLGGPSH